MSKDPSFAWRDSAELQALFALLNRHGGEVRVVGGAVRNGLLGMVPGDIDCATTHLPQAVMDMAAEVGVRAIPTGIDHGTVTLVIGSQSFEVTSLRADVETDGRHAVVRFGQDWAQDAARRDFTMNALYMDHKGWVHDHLGCGVRDAKQRHVRFIGVADQRIEEDYLRILRFFRFYAQYGHGFEQADYEACIRGRSGLADLSAERIGAEMSKLLSGVFAPAALSSMLGAGLLAEIMPSVPMVGRFARLITLSRQIGHVPSLALRIAAFGCATEEAALRIAAAWRLSNRERDRLLLFARLKCSADAREMSLEALRKLAYHHGQLNAVEVMLLGMVDRCVANADVVEFSGLMEMVIGWDIPKLPVSGKDLMKAGVPTGPEIGALLKDLERRWIASGFVLRKEALMEIAAIR